MLYEKLMPSSQLPREQVFRSAKLKINGCEAESVAKIPLKGA